MWEQICCYECLTCKLKEIGDSVNEKNYIFDFISCTIIKCLF